jgi:hypothetical protein
VIFFEGVQIFPNPLALFSGEREHFENPVFPMAQAKRSKEQSSGEGDARD